MTEACHPRERAARINRALNVFPVVVVSGPRQAGKSTLLQCDPAFAGRPYVTLDDLNTLSAAQADPDGILLSESVITVDEAQGAPEMFLALKRLVDRDRRPGQFLLSGSANFLLLSNLGDSLAGRACYLNLMPFSAREHQQETARDPFLVEVLSGRSPREAARGRTLTFEPTDVLRGGFPVPRLHEGPDYAEWFIGYEQTYLEGCIRAELQKRPKILVA